MTSIPNAITSLSCITAISTAVYMGCRFRDTPHARSIRLSIGWLALAATTIGHAIWLLDDFDIQVSLPLHICDIASFAVAGALILQTRWMRSIAYFWGIALSSWAFITPMDDSDVFSVQWLLFWSMHLFIVGIAIYDLIVERYRPTRRDLLFISIISLTYLAVVFSLNLAIDTYQATIDNNPDGAPNWYTNYGFIGNNQPTNPTPINLLGPWPLRILWLTLLAHLAFLIAYLPWEFSYRRSNAQTNSTLA